LENENVLIISPFLAVYKSIGKWRDATIIHNCGVVIPISFKWETVFKNATKVYIRGFDGEYMPLLSQFPQLFRAFLPEIMIK